MGRKAVREGRPVVRVRDGVGEVVRGIGCFSASEATVGGSCGDVDEGAMVMAWLRR